MLQSSHCQIFLVFCRKNWTDKTQFEPHPEESEKLADFAKNPQQFISEAITRINYCKRLSIVDGIKYYPLKGEVYAQSLFMDKELTDMPVIF